MPEWAAAILEWIRVNPHLAGITIGIVAFLEGLAVVGIIVPGIVILFGFGTLVGLQVLELATVWAWCSGGAIAGDAVSFWLGRHFKDRLPDMWPFSRYPDLLSNGEAFFRRHGLKSVIIGRFVGPIRPIIPVVAGMLNMPLKIYIPANLGAGVAWAPAYLLPGVVFGASIELAQAVAWRLALVLIVIAALVWLVSVVMRGAYLLLAPRAERMLAGALIWGRNHPRLGGLTANLVDPRRPESVSLLALALLLVAATVTGLWALVTLHRANPEVDETVSAAIGALRSPWADQFMVLLNGLGSPLVLGAASLALFFWLCLRRRWLAAAHLAVAVAFGVLLAFVTTVVLGALTGSAGPAGFLSGQVVVTVSVLGFVALLLTHQLPNRNRWWPYLAAAVVVGLVGLTRIYLGALDAGELVLGISVGLVWVTALGIAYRRRRRRPFLLYPAAAIFWLAMAGALLVDYRLLADRVLDSAFPPAQPTSVTLGELNRFAEEAAEEEAVSYYVVGETQPLLDSLAGDGWETPAAADWRMPVAMLQPEPKAATLPLLPATLGNYEAAAERSRLLPDGAQQVLRIWPTNLQLEGTSEPVWAVRSGRFELDRVAFFFHFWRPAAPAPLTAVPDGYLRRERVLLESD
ncbi:MAG: VTT domain-containing protein [Pseudomonadota bacterium]